MRHNSQKRVLTLLGISDDKKFEIDDITTNNDIEQDDNMKGNYIHDEYRNGSTELRNEYEHKDYSSGVGGRYGLGTIRTLEDFQIQLGVDFKTKSISNNNNDILNHYSYENVHSSLSLFKKSSNTNSTIDDLSKMKILNLVNSFM